MDLMSAAANGDLRLVRRVLAQGCDLNALNTDGDTALMLAEKGNRVEVMTFLLVGGANVNLRRTDGSTALHLAVASQHSRAAKLLLDFDADASVANNDGVTPLLLAAENGLSKLIKLLVKMAPESIQVAYMDGSNVLAVAAQAGQVEAVGMFIDAGFVRGFRQWSWSNSTNVRCCNWPSGDGEAVARERS